MKKEQKISEGSVNLTLPSLAKMRYIVLKKLAVPPIGTLSKKSVLL